MKREGLVVTGERAARRVQRGICVPCKSLHRALGAGADVSASAWVRACVQLGGPRRTRLM